MALGALGPGSPGAGVSFGSAYDVNLYRSAADTLKTDDAFHVALAFSHLGSTLGFYGATPTAQIAGATDVLAGLVTQGLRAASSNPPLNLGSGAITSGQITASGAILAAAGTATAPGIAWSADADGSGTGLYRPGTNQIGFATNGNNAFTITATPAVAMADGTHFTFTGGGTKFGTATSQPLGFHNATPSIQRAGAAQAAVVTTGAALASYGYTQAQADAIVTLVNELRAALVEKGLIKGAA